MNVFGNWKETVISTMKTQMFVEAQGRLFTEYIKRTEVVDDDQNKRIRTLDDERIRGSR